MNLLFLSPNFGSTIPILLFFLGKHFFDSKTGLVAALLGSLNPMLINLLYWVLRETLSPALILMLIFTAHSTIGIRSKKRSLIATLLPGFLSGLIILTREEMLFIIPPAYILGIPFTVTLITKTNTNHSIDMCILSSLPISTLALFKELVYMNIESDLRQSFF